ncbi:hypothetical protein ACKWTF_012622 [Chironomus riparius]
MARKQEISFFTDIQSDEQFEEFLKQNVLLVLDVYQEMYGPCVSLQSTLEQQKVSLSDSDSLQLATCNANKIEKLKRFRAKSLPTILFCKDRKVLFISYGAIIPQIQNILGDYFKLNEEGHIFQGYDFDEYLPFEMKAVEQKRAEEAERLRIEYEAAQAEKFSKLDEIIDLMNKNSSDMGITLFMPHVAKDAFRKTLETAKWLSLVNRAGKMIQITPDMMETLNYNLENPIDERILEEIYYKDIFAVLWYMDPRTPVTDVLKEFIKRVSEPVEYEVEGEESVWETILDSLVIDPIKYEESERVSTESIAITIEDKSEATLPLDSLQPSAVMLAKKKSSQLSRVSKRQPSVKEQSIRQPSVKEQSIRDSVKEQKSPSLSQIELDEEIESEGFFETIEDDLVTIPPVWTPANQSGNAIFMHQFFRAQFESFLPPIIEPEPPHICMIFPAKIRDKVIEVCEEHPKGLLDYGFYEGEDFDDFIQICKSVESFDKLELTGREKMILKVSKKTSHLALDLANLSPLYVSHNVSEGQEECSMLFKEELQDDELQDDEPENFDTQDDDLQSDEQVDVEY